MGVGGSKGGFLFLLQLCVVVVLLGVQGDRFLFYGFSRFYIVLRFLYGLRSQLQRNYQGGRDLTLLEGAAWCGFSVLARSRIRRFVYFVGRGHICGVRLRYLSTRIIRRAPQDSSSSLYSALWKASLLCSVLSSMGQRGLSSVRVSKRITSLIYRLSYGLSNQTRGSHLRLFRLQICLFRGQSSRYYNLANSNLYLPSRVSPTGRYQGYLYLGQ